MSSSLTRPPVSTNHAFQRAARSLSLGSLAKLNTPTGTMTRLQKTMRLLACPVVLGSMALTGCSPPKTSYTVTKAVVTKVFSATDPSGHRFVAYAVDRGGVEIIVSDTLAKSTYKVGDTIQYLDQKIEISAMKTLNSTLLSFKWK